MEMKWHPIEAGSMKGVPRDKDIIFTLLNEDTGEVYTAVGKVDEHTLKKYGFVMVGVTTYPFETELFKAWAELPEPYNPKANAIKAFLTDEEQNQVLKAMRETGKFVSEVKY